MAEQPRYLDIPLTPRARINTGKPARTIRLPRRVTIPAGPYLLLSGTEEIHAHVRRACGEFFIEHLASQRQRDRERRRHDMLISRGWVCDEARGSRRWQLPHWPASAWVTRRQALRLMLEQKQE